MSASVGCDTYNWSRQNELCEETACKEVTRNQRVSREARHLISNNALLVIATNWSHCSLRCSWGINGLHFTPLKREYFSAQFMIICTQEGASQIVITVYKLEDMQELLKVRYRRKFLNERATESWKIIWLFYFYSLVVWCCRVLLQCKSLYGAIYLKTHNYL